MLRLICLGILLSVSAAGTPAQPKQSLTLTAEIVSQKYCGTGSGSASLEMRLKLKYANVGKDKLILYKGHDLFYQTRIRSVPNNEGTKPYEISFVNSRYFDKEFELIDAPSPSKVFVSLAPGAIF